jgi:FMN reductase
MKTSAIRVLIIASSLNPDSRSQILAREIQKRLSILKVETDFIDLRNSPLPLAGSDESWSNSNVRIFKEQTQKATHILFAVPVYNYDVNAAAKNFVELIGSDGFEDKTVGFVCSAGGKSSYMSVMSFANSLMLDFRCWIVPRFIYVDHDFDLEKLDAKLDERINGLISDMIS